MYNQGGNWDVRSWYEKYEFFYGKLYVLETLDEFVMIKNDFAQIGNRIMELVG